MSAKKTSPAKRKTTSQKKKKDKGICFTIMPFGGWMDNYYEDIYCPAIEAAGLVPRRADDLFRPSTIVSDIWEYTRKAELLLADLTGKNPNVLYESGLAHAIAKPVILMTGSLDDVPFDLRSLRIIEYDKNDPKWGEMLRDSITQAIKETMESPLQSTPSTFLEVKGEKEALSPREKELLELRQEMDLLRREIRTRTDRKPEALPRVRRG